MTFDDWLKTYPMDPINRPPILHAMEDAWDAAQQARWTPGNTPPQIDPMNQRPFLVLNHCGEMRVGRYGNHFWRAWPNHGSQYVELGWYDTEGEPIDIVAWCELPAPYKPEAKR